MGLRDKYNYAVTTENLMLGNASSYTEIFNANRDQLSDPNMIKPGQVLKIPQHV